MWGLAEALEPSTKAGWEYLKCLPMSRAKRRRLLKRRWIVHLCVGPKMDASQTTQEGVDPFVEFEGMGFEFLSLDILVGKPQPLEIRRGMETPFLGSLPREVGRSVGRTAMSDMVCAALALPSGSGHDFSADWHLASTGQKL